MPFAVLCIEYMASGDVVTVLRDAKTPFLRSRRCAEGQSVDFSSTTDDASRTGGSGPVGPDASKYSLKHAREERTEMRERFRSPYQLQYAQN